MAPFMAMKAVLLNDSQRTRNNLRLSTQLRDEINMARRRRAGNVTRNTWITKAVTEKLAKSQPIKPKNGNQNVSFF